MPPAIIDELTELPISRQRRYQLRKRREGRCVRCGQEAIQGGCFCETHRQLNNITIREAQRRRFGLKNRYYDAESYHFFGSCPRGQQLLDAARGYLQAGRAGAAAQFATANLHTSLLVGFSALEAFVDTIVGDLDVSSLMTAHEQRVLRPSTIEKVNGAYRLSEARSIEERVRYLLENFSSTSFDREAGYWRGFQQAATLRNQRLRPSPLPISASAAENALSAIVNLLNALFVGIYGRQ